MRLQILHVPDCPNAAVLAARLDEVLAGRGDVEVEQRTVADQDEAVAVGMTGSPTLLVEGTDPFAMPGWSASVSCRLYIGESPPSRCRRERAALELRADAGRANAATRR